MKITDIDLKIIPDSRGEPTLKAVLVIDSQSVFASVPSGKSKGLHEAKSINPTQALQKLAGIKPELLNQDFTSLDEFDQFLFNIDRTKDKENLGANLILVLSIAFCKAWAKVQNKQVYQIIAELADNRNIKIPFCFFNLINGGEHAQNSLPFQEYMLIPDTASAKASLELAEATIKKLQPLLSDQQGDEGGFTLPSSDPVEGLRVLTKALTDCGSSYFLGLDVAASTFYDDGKYRVGAKQMDSNKLLKLYQTIVTEFKILSIEDPFSELDIDGFKNMFSVLSEKIWVVGDDLTVTNTEIISKAYEQRLVNAVIIKPNQIGSVTEAIQAAKLAQNYGWKVIVSHRSGETEDNFIADLAVGLGVDGLKAGAPTKPERLAKYARLLEIEQQLLTDRQH